MLQEFRKFLLQTNALALAVGVIIGAAVGKLVGSLVSDILMPLIGLVIPGGAWRELAIVLSTKPDGTPRKLLDVSRLNSLGWKATISIEDGLRDTYRWFLANQDRFRG